MSKAFNGAVALTLADVADELLDFPPGSQYHYSDTDNIVAALMIEAATGVSYERELSALVLDPLALRDTSMPEGYRMPTPYVHGYGGKDDDSELFNPTLAWASAHGVHAAGSHEVRARLFGREADLGRDAVGAAPVRPRRVGAARAGHEQRRLHDLHRRVARWIALGGGPGEHPDRAGAGLGTGVPSPAPRGRARRVRRAVRLGSTASGA